MTSTPHMTYTTDDGAGREFRWHGGEYIEIGYTDELGEFNALDVINVWDHAKGEPRIPRTLDAFAARCDQWVAARADDDDSGS